jgi:hypothetical protein
MKTLLSIIFSLCLLNGYSQTTSWKIINLSNWGLIKLPPTMEVQSGTYKRILDNSKKEFSINADRIVFQQKGLDKFGSFSTYARVIIRTDHANQGDFPKLNQMNLTQTDLSDLNAMYKDEITSSCNKMNAKLLNYTNVKTSTLDGVKCVYFNYTRQMLGKSATFSEFYIFYNNDKQHTINFEYWTSDIEKWKTVFENCKKTFKFKVMKHNK